jgi:chitinase
MKTLNCNADMCEDEEDACNDESGWYESSSDGYSSLTKRSYKLPNGKLMWSYDRGEIEERAKAVRPGDPRAVKIYINTILGSSLFKNLEIESRAYPTGLNVLKGDGASTLPLQGGFT